MRSANPSKMRASRSRVPKVPRFSRLISCSSPLSIPVRAASTGRVNARACQTPSSATAARFPVLSRTASTCGCRWGTCRRRRSRCEERKSMILRKPCATVSRVHAHSSVNDSRKRKVPRPMPIWDPKKSRTLPASRQKRNKRFRRRRAV